VYFNNAEDTSRWSYASGTTTITTTGSENVAMWLNPQPSPPSTGGSSARGFSMGVLFTVTLHGEPVPNCQIRIYREPYATYVRTIYTDIFGESEINLDQGKYTFIAEYQHYNVSGSWTHIEYEELAISLDKGETTVRKPSLTLAIVATLIACLVVVGAVTAMRNVKVT
jgi:hypothetical protein